MSSPTFTTKWWNWLEQLLKKKKRKNFLVDNVNKDKVRGFPGGLAVKNQPANDPTRHSYWCLHTLELTLHKRNPGSEKPAHSNQDPAQPETNMSLNKRLGWETPHLQNKDKVEKSCSKLTSSRAFISFALSMYLYTFFSYSSFFCLTLSKYVVAIMTFCPYMLPYPLHNHNIPLIHTIILYTVYIQMLPIVPGIPLMAFLFPNLQSSSGWGLYSVVLSLSSPSIWNI